MAGSLIVVETESQEKEMPINTNKEQWQVHFARFITFPFLPSTCPSLVPLAKNRRNRAPRGNWIATSFPAASLQIISDLYSSETILAVCLSGKILEEHHVSKLHFSWPQVQCIPEYPARGSRAVFVSYKNSDNTIQKFALRFSTHHEAESFISALKMNLKGEVQTEPLNTDFGSQLLTQSEFISSNGLPSRACQELSDMNPADFYTPQMDNLEGEARIEPSTTDFESQFSTRSEFISSNGLLSRACQELSDMTPGNSYTPQMDPGLSYEIGQHSSDQDAMLNHNSESIFRALPPSFTSLLINCCSTAEKATIQPTVSGEIDLKSQIMRYMEDSSFQDMLRKVEKIISEVGADMLL